MAGPHCAAGNCLPGTDAWFMPVFIALFAVVAALFGALGVVQWRERSSQRRRTRKPRTRRGAHFPVGREAVSAVTVAEIERRLRAERRKRALPPRRVTVRARTPAVPCHPVHEPPASDAAAADNYANDTNDTDMEQRNW